MRFLLLLVIGCWIAGGLLAPAASSAQPEPPPALRGRPDAGAVPDAGADPLLGPVFESRSAGIAFRAPAGAKQTRRAAAGEDIAQFIDDDRKWQLRVGRVQFAQPLPITSHKDQDGADKPGLLEITLEQLRLDKPGAEILRDEVITVGDATIGMIAARYSLGLDTLLHQQALVRASDRHYFVFTFTTPAPRDADLAGDESVRAAVETFNAVLDSVRLLDQSDIRADQTDRLFRTRSLYLNVNETRLRNALIREQWMRLTKGDRDVGYLYVVEEVAADLPRKGATKRKPGGADGVLIGVRSRTIPDTGVQVDAENWMWLSFDRRHEKWSSVATIAGGAAAGGGAAKRETISEFGVSDMEAERVLDRTLRGGDVRPDNTVDANQPPTRVRENYTLEVTHFRRSATAQPVKRDLPVFYMPQALSHLLPRLLPRFEPKGYMFASYLSEQREVMARYVDVEREESVTLGGKTVRAIPIVDRTGLEGAATVHYLSPDGRWLGSVNAETQITVLPTDARTLASIWKDADLTRPAAVDESTQTDEKRDR